MVAHRDVSRAQGPIPTGRLRQGIKTFPKRRSHAYDEINSPWSPWSLFDVYGSNVVKGHTMPVRVHRHDYNAGPWSSLEFLDTIHSPKDKETVGHCRGKKNLTAATWSARTCQVPKAYCTDNLAWALELYCSMRETW